MEWRPFPPDPRYEASEDGQVRKRDGRTRDDRWKIFNQWTLKGKSRGGKGYKCCNVAGRTMLVGRVVCWCFHGPPAFKEMHAAHENGKRADNRASNLSWKSPRANEQDKKRHGTFLEGERHHCSKLSDAQVVDLRTLKQNGSSFHELAEHFGLSVSHTRSICYGLHWKSSGGPRSNRNRHKPNLKRKDRSIIKDLHNSGFTNADIAILYRVTASTISRITQRK